MGGWCARFYASSAPKRQNTSKTIKIWSGTYPGMGWWGGFIKLALYIQNPCRFHETCQTYRERVTEGRESLKMGGGGGGGWCARFCASSAPKRQKTSKTHNTWLGTYPGMGWWGGFIKFALYIQNPCHFLETCQTYRERVTKGRESLKMWGWCARFCASRAPKRQKTTKTHKTWLGTYPGMGWWGGFIKLTLYIKTPCHFHETCQIYREMVTEGEDSFETGGWCARFLVFGASSAPKRQKTLQTHKTWSETYPVMSWWSGSL